MKQVDYDYILKNYKGENLNCLYLWENDSGCFKVGLSRTGLFTRGASNDYWTSHGNNGNFTVLYTATEIEIDEMFKYEKKVINYCKENVRNGNAGREVFIFEKEWSDIIIVKPKIINFIS